MQLTDARSLSTIRILIVEDDEDDYLIISDYFKYIPGHLFQTAWCKDYQEALDLMQKASYDVYFIDYHLTGKTGLDLLTEAMIDECEAPMILLTGNGNPSIDKKAMRLGAADYLIKSELNSEKLERCIRYALERAANLRELKESERQYRKIFERTNDMIFLADAHLMFKNTNEAGSAIFGYQKEELLKKRLFDLFLHEEDKQNVKSKLSHEGRVNDYQVELNTGNKEKKIGLLSASFETDLKGRLYVQGIIHEITLLKRMEDIAVQIEKLEAKGRVIRTLAHEVRNPLNNIQLSVANLKSSDVQHTTECIEIIERNSKRINDLINDLMDSTRYHKMQLTVASLQSVMDEALEVALDRLALSKIKLNVNYSPEPAFAMLDTEKLRIAFLNLIINAIEAMEENKGMMNITVNNKRDFHEVRIQDNGCGMTKETIQKLFEPYYTSKPNGLGLGLTTTHAIIVSHEATISVSSTVQEGSVFTIIFPGINNEQSQSREEH